MAPRFNASDFIKKAHDTHGNLYDYSLVDYVDKLTKVTIICSQHGQFQQRPKTHLLGSGCRACGYIKIGKARASNASDFIKKTHDTHGELYDYSLVDYVDKSTKVTIICSQHGEFEQTPNNHLSGHGCPQCSHIRPFRSNTSDFIEKAHDTHGELYDYSLVDYKGAHAKVTIICSQHGQFQQTPISHLSGRHCRKCGSFNSKCSQRSDVAEYIERAKSFHFNSYGNLYDYSLVEYVNSLTKIKIICSVHGVFEQSPCNHLHYGCPLCGVKRRKGENHPRWDFSKSDEERVDRRGSYYSELKIWRGDIFSRDSHACRKCGDSKGGNLNAHHVLPWARYPDERLVVDNGITLCEPCHDKYHSIYGTRDRCNRDSMNAYLVSNPVGEVVLSA